MHEQDLKIKKYVNAVERRLRMPLDIRSRVMSDFGSSISARREAGESVEEILDSMGTPKQAAAELNEQMKDYTYRKSRWRFLFLGAAVLGGISLLGKAISVAIVYSITGSESASLGIIGGSDGPTSIFVATPLEAPTIEMKIILNLILVALCLFGFYKFSHLKQK